MSYLIVDDEELIIKDTLRQLRKIIPEKAEVYTASDYLEAMEIVKQHKPHIAFLDIDMPVVNGLKLADMIIAESPYTNIIFVTAYPNYSLDAWGTEASAFVVKPINVNKLQDAMSKIRVKDEKPKKRLQFRCFGNFEVLCDGKVVSFERVRSKELLAYLVDRRDSYVSTGDIRYCLWAEDDDTDAKKTYVRVLIADIKKTMDSLGIEDLVLHNRNYYCLDSSKFDCDFYDYLDGNSDVEYIEEYMSQYAWAEYRTGYDTDY